MAREERRLQHRPEKWRPVFGTADALKEPAQGRNLTDPLKARPPHGKGRISAGPQARTSPRGKPAGTDPASHASP
ncbi:hypothetical protein [Rhizobium sp. NPDC090279]|uniref:hypothetical protein n=1 Tax=Rhizobium sp. NPDC090279 TaxID=3364499 RepID=UPI00383A696A